MRNKIVTTESYIRYKTIAFWYKQAVSYEKT